MLKSRKNPPEILYPSIDFSKFYKYEGISDIKNPFFLSLNRYEKKKNVQLALYAFELFSNKNPNYLLVIAGGYDEKILENRENYAELLQIAINLNIKEKVIFKFSISNEEKLQLLTFASAVLYTPPNEHFGIVPVECMYMEKPVLGINSGGPVESIIDGETGFLIENEAYLWAEKMVWIGENKELCRKMGRRGKERAIEKFGFNVFKERIDHYVRMCDRKE